MICLSVEKILAMQMAIRTFVENVAWSATLGKYRLIARVERSYLSISSVDMVVVDPGT
jgi:hypothetical protein